MTNNINVVKRGTAGRDFMNSLVSSVLLMLVIVMLIANFVVAIQNKRYSVVVCVFFHILRGNKTSFVSIVLHIGEVSAESKRLRILNAVGLKYCQKKGRRK